MAKAALTFAEFAGLQNGRISRLTFKGATLILAGYEGDRVFKMSGPSGVHTLRVDATDFDRLNAHWVPFATHPANDFPIAK